MTPGGDGVRPPESAEKSLGDVVGDVSTKASLLVREEIELAKAEIQLKIKRLGAGAAAGAAAGVFLVFALVAALHALAYVFTQLVFDSSDIWLGYLVVTGLLVLLAAIAGLLALRFVKRGAPPTPDLAIEEAKRTRAAIEEARN